MKKLINKIRFWFFIRALRKETGMTHKQANEFMNRFLNNVKKAMEELVTKEYHKKRNPSYFNNESKIMSTMN